VGYRRRCLIQDAGPRAASPGSAAENRAAKAGGSRDGRAFF